MADSTRDDEIRQLRQRTQQLQQEVLGLRRENRRLGSPVVAWDEIASAAGLGEARIRMGMRPFMFQSSGGHAWLDSFYRCLPEHDLSPAPFQWNLLWHPNAGRDLPVGPGVMHVYYPHHGGNVDEAGARSRSEAIVEELEAYVDQGGRLLWTMFEEATAGAPFPEVDFWLREQVARLASVVHVTHEATVRRAQRLYRLPDDKIHIIPHPLEHDVYPDVVSRRSARGLLGLGPDDYAVLAFGALREQKAADRLLDAVRDLAGATDRTIRVVLAGRVNPQEAAFGRRVIELAQQVPGTISLVGHIPDRNVMPLFRASDLAVLPYRWSSNSGVMMIALGIGLPVLGPDEPVFTELADASRLVRVFETGSDALLRRELARAVQDDLSLQAPDDHILRRHDPDLVSQRLARVSASLLDDG